jgi:hypothetical protein
VNAIRTIRLARAAGAAVNGCASTPNQVGIFARDASSDPLTALSSASGDSLDVDSALSTTTNCASLPARGQRIGERGSRPTVSRGSYPAVKSSPSTLVFQEGAWRR